MRLRNILFIATLCVVLCGPCVLLVVQDVVRLEVPQQLTSDEAAYLSGGRQKSNVLKRTSIRYFVDGTLQEAIENSIGNYIPAKASAILTNAGIQRATIKLSSELFGINCYPTFFGSNIVYLADQDALIRKPLRRSGVAIEALDEFAVSLSCFAADHDKLRIHVLVADISEVSAANPVSSLISGVFKFDECFACLEDAFSQVGNIDLTACAFSDSREYFRYYYTTDHHWNGFGAQLAYAATRKDLASNVPSEVRVSNENMVMDGSAARAGLDLIGEAVCEPMLDVSRLKVTNGMKAALMTYQGSIEKLAKEKDPLAKYDFYHFWYGSSVETHIVNEMPLMDTRALLICDSYGSAIQWCIAGDYAETSTFYDLHNESKGEERLEDRLSSGNYSDLFLVATLNNFAGMQSRFPNYFE